VGFVKSFRSTSANGIAGYDDYQNDSLCDVFQHCSINLMKFPGRSSAKSMALALEAGQISSWLGLRQ
jgi:hypothetical protein